MQEKDNNQQPNDKQPANMQNAITISFKEGKPFVTTVLDKNTTIQVLSLAILELTKIKPVDKGEQ